MALIQWKQINPELLGNGRLTGSLEITGSFILNGQELDLSGGAVSTNQTLSLNGYDLSISNGNTVTLPQGGETVDTGSLITSASAEGNIITFTFGDGSTQFITVDTGSSGGTTVDNTALNAFTSSYYIDSASFDQRIANISTTGGSVPLGTISSSAQIEALGYALTSSVLSLQSEIDNLTAQTSSYLTSIPPLSLGDLSNVDLSTLSDGQLLGFDSASNSWKPVEGYGNGDITAVIASEGLIGGGTTGPVALEVNPGDGISVNSNGVNIDTGSNHFISGVIDLSIFQQTGSYYSTTNELQVTGSLTLRKDESGDALSVYSGSVKTFGITGDGLLRFMSQSSTPQAVAGGMYFDTNYDLFIGQE